MNVAGIALDDHEVHFTITTVTTHIIYDKMTAIEVTATTKALLCNIDEGVSSAYRNVAFIVHHKYLYWNAATSSIYKIPW